MNNEVVANYGGKGDHIQIATIRKGNQKKADRPGENLGHRLRVNFDAKNEDAREYMQRFEEFYTLTGRVFHELRPSEYAVLDVPFIMPLPDFAAFDFAYSINGSYPLGRSDIRGEYWEWLREPGSMEMLVYAGEVRIRHIDLQGNEWEPGMPRLIDPTLPVFNYRGRDYMPKSHMELKMLLPYLRTARYMKVVSTSVNDARHIYNQLIWIKSIADNCRFPWFKVPLTLSRREREITKNYGEQPHRENEWLLSVDIASPDLEAEFLTNMGGDYFSPEVKNG